MCGERVSGALQGVVAFASSCVVRFIEQNVTRKHVVPVVLHMGLVDTGVAHAASKNDTTQRCARSVQVHVQLSGPGAYGSLRLSWRR